MAPLAVSAAAIVVMMKCWCRDRGKARAWFDAGGNVGGSKLRRASGMSTGWTGWTAEDGVVK